MSLYFFPQQLKALGSQPGEVRGGFEIRFHEGSTRFCEGCGVAPHCWGCHLSFFIYFFSGHLLTCTLLPFFVASRMARGLWFLGLLFSLAGCPFWVSLGLGWVSLGFSFFWGGVLVGWVSWPVWLAMKTSAFSRGSEDSRASSA